MEENPSLRVVQVDHEELQQLTADQTVVQRYLAARTDRSALRGMWLGASLCLPIWTAFMFIGSLLWAFYKLTGERLPTAVTRPDQVFPQFMVSHMPLGVAGLFLAALFGAAMSMLASDLNCLGKAPVMRHAAADVAISRQQTSQPRSDKSRLRQ